MEKLFLICPECGDQVSTNCDYCAECGTYILSLCDDCGVELETDTEIDTGICEDCISHQLAEEEAIKETQYSLDNYHR